MTKEKNQDFELTLESLYDVPVQISVVLGKTSMSLNHLLQLNKGAVIELDRVVGEPVDVYVNGKIVARGKSIPIEELYKAYEVLLLEALKLKATTRKNTNVLQHIMGYFKKELSSDEKAELLEVFDQYHRELIPLIVPITLVNHYVRKYKQPYLSEQTYLRPHPISLRLRNHV